jgi:hypothetical protein
MSGKPHAAANVAPTPGDATDATETVSGAEHEASDAAQPARIPSQRPSAGAAAVANEIVAGTAARGIDHYVRALVDPKESVWTQAARVVEETANQKPELLAPHIERMVAALGSDHTRVAQCAAHVLPQLARVAPAKVAKHLKTMQASFAAASEIARDGLVHTFVALCLASVIYQKRLIESFEQALREADAKILPRWVELILPALKGEPYAQARGVVEKRLADPELARPTAQRVADLIGVKLRVVPR